MTSDQKQNTDKITMATYWMWNIETLYGYINKRDTFYLLISV